MALHPRAIQNHVSFERYMPACTPRAIFLHTNGGGTGPPGVGLTNWFNQLWSNPAYGMAGQGIGSHFQVFTNGQFDQLCDTNRVVFAQFQASRWSLAIETQDNGNPSTPWTDPQMAAIADILTWAGQTHGIPLRLMGNPNDAGIGYHEQFSQWNSDSHACPGVVRERQLLSEIIPSLQHNSPHVTGGLKVSDFPTIGGRDKSSIPYKTALTHQDNVQVARALLQLAGAFAAPRTGGWDDKDAGAVEWFQGQKKLPVDAIIGDQTWAALLHVKANS
jgi:hypothetical protein